jgi:hypothetical protein
MELSALILSLPTRNSTVRMRVWRALKDCGCAVLRDGVYVVPAHANAAPVLASLERDIRASGGFAMRAALELNDDEYRSHVLGLFDRSAAYGALREQIRQARAVVRRLGPRKAETTLTRLQRHLERLVALDYFPGAAKTQTTDAFSTLQRDYREAYGKGEPRVSRRRLKSADRDKYQSRTWATRKDPWVDRLASAWLIRRFIDPKARFVWLARPSELPKRAIGFDYDGAQFTHVGNRVTFEVLMETFGLDTDGALAAIGASVHFLDVGGSPAPDAKGLETVLKGVKEKAADDDAMLAEATRIFDHFYSAYAERGTPSRPG